jgi:3-isopropylmalate/(R)-2-methylmalate dehydratase large subunit
VSITAQGFRTLYNMIWHDHLIDEQPDGTCLIYIDRHLVDEVDSPQAFAALRLAGLRVHAPDKTLLVVDHNVPTSDRTNPNPDPESAAQIAYLAENAKLFGLEYYDEFDKRQGICHVVGPEQGFTLPGVTLVCGDSHTATHGAFGALAFGIGTSETEHVFATQTLIQSKLKNMRLVVDGQLPPDVTAKDLALAIVGEIGAAGGIGYALEYAGEAIRALSMEGRMTVCNMSVEAGAKIGIVAPDEKTYEYLKGRPKAPKGASWDDAMRYWETLRTHHAAQFDREIKLDAAKLPPLVTWGTNPEQVVAITGRVPMPAEIADERKRRAAMRSLEYMGLNGGERITDIAVDRVFIGSCTNSRIEDLRDVARIANGKTVNSNVRAMIVPGSGLVKEQAEAEGLHKIFIKAGFDWREPGCSMCLAMNPDKLKPGERCASTSNRNFEGRQGHKGRTHLVSPAMAAAAAIAGKFVDVRSWG